MDRPTSALPVLPYASSYPDPALLASKLHNRQPFLVRVQIAVSELLENTSYERSYTPYLAYKSLGC